MRIVCMGTGGFAVPSFQALMASPHDVVAVVTRPTRRGGKSQKKPPAAPMRVAAEAAQMPVHDPPSVNDNNFANVLDELAADLFFVCDYGEILSDITLSRARWGGINLHGSLLPAYRGAAPVQWAVYDGRGTTGVSVIHMTPRLDAGPVLADRQTTIGPDESADKLEQRLAELGTSATLEAIALLERWDGVEPLGRPQDPTQATKAPRLKKSDGLVDWRRSARQLANQIRAFKPWPLTYTFWQPATDKPAVRLVIDAARPCDTPRPSDTATPALPGTIVASDPLLLVATGDGLLQIERLQPAGKRVMDTADFLRGHPLPVGTQLTGG